MVVNKNKTMKLGAALITAGLGATGMACDGDENVIVCGADLTTFVAASGWSCTALDSEGDPTFDIDIEMSDDGTGFWVFEGEFDYDVTWEEGDDCTVLVTFDYPEGDDWQYELSDLDVSGDGTALTFTAEDLSDEDDIFDVECEIAEEG